MMKHCLFSVPAALMLLVTACSNAPEIAKRDLELRGTLYYAKGAKVPFSGKVVDDELPAGWGKKVHFLQKGIPEGKFQRINLHGAVFDEGNWESFKIKGGHAVLQHVERISVLTQDDPIGQIKIGYIILKHPVSWDDTTAISHYALQYMADEISGNMQIVSDELELNANSDGGGLNVGSPK